MHVSDLLDTGKKWLNDVYIMHEKLHKPIETYQLHTLRYTIFSLSYLWKASSLIFKKLNSVIIVFHAFSLQDAISK